MNERTEVHLCTFNISSISYLLIFPLLSWVSLSSSHHYHVMDGKRKINTQLCYSIRYEMVFSGLGVRWDGAGKIPV